MKSTKEIDLLSEIDIKSKEIAVKTLSMPLRELANLYEKESLIINPNFQRFYRWDRAQKTNFIESILLGLPIPPIFVSINGKRWELIDGLQRLSTIFEYFGILRSEISVEKEIRSGLLGTDYLPSLENITYNTMPELLNFHIEWNTRIDVIILDDKSKNKDAKYELFYRLNTGGSSLSNQEVRSSIMIMENEEFYNNVSDVKNNENFINMILLSDKDSEEQLDLEFVLRFFAVKNFDESDGKIKSVKKFIDKKTSQFLAKFNVSDFKIFLDVFEFLNKNFDTSPFRIYDKSKSKFKGRMNFSSYDIIGAGLGYSLSHNIIDLNKDKDFIILKILLLSQNESFLNSTKVGFTSEQKLAFSINFGRNYFIK